MKVTVPKSMRSQIQKAQTSLFIVVMVASVISIFCLTSAKVLLSQGAYQRHVVNARHDAVKQLNDNIKAANQLVDQYNNVFENSGPSNVIGGKNDTSPKAVPPDGDNARIVLDGLPTSYDFPALVSSLSKIISADNIQNISIGGSDESASANNAATSSPKPVLINVPVSGSGSYSDLQKLIGDLERSIRPYDITNLQMSGSNANMTFNLQMNTYYQSPKTLDVSSKVVSK